MPQIPSYIAFIFLVTALIATLIFLRAAHWDRKTIGVLIIWAGIQSILGISGFYQQGDSFPPRFILLLAPPMITILSLIVRKKGRDYLDLLDIRWLTIIHVIRLPVEIVLYLLLQQKWIPELMSFDGRNPDILSGITAIPVFLLAFRKEKINRILLLVWNFCALALVFNIVINGLLSAPSPFQQFAFEQPNIAVLHFPFNLLPSMVVPLVILSHVASIRQLIKQKR